MTPRPKDPPSHAVPLPVGDGATTMVPVEEPCPSHGNPTDRVLPDYAMPTVLVLLALLVVLVLPSSCRTTAGSHVSLAGSYSNSRML